jgi:hypothetical protein
MQIRRFLPLIIPIVLTLVSCGGIPPPLIATGQVTSSEVTVQRELIRTEPAEAPDWRNNPPQNGAEIYFVGVSRVFDTAADARNAARDDAFSQIVKYYGQSIQIKANEKTTVSGSSGDVLIPYIEQEEEITRFAQAVVSQVGADKYYTEVYFDGRNREEYIVYVLCQISRAKAEQDINEFEQKISERYGNLISTPSTLIGAINVYRDIYTNLQQNPLHQMTASYNSPQGKVSLFDYCRVQMNALSGTVSFMNTPGQKVPKGETLSANIRLSSSLISAIGTVPCRVTISGRNNGAPAAIYTVGLDNSFLLEIKTALLEAGNYNVQLELLLNEGSLIVLRNPSGGFSFEVTPVSAVITFSGEELTTNEQIALTQAVQQGIQKYNVPFQNGYQFEVHISIRSQVDSVSKTELLLSDVSIGLLQGGNIVSQSENKRITEMNRERTVTLAGNFIRENAAFWNGVKEMLEK